MTMAGIPRLLRRLPSDVLRLRRRRTAPGKPPTGYVDVYADATGALAGVDDAGAALSIAGTPASIANAGGSLAVDGSGNMLGITPVAGTITLRIGTSPTVGALLRMDGSDFTLNADDQAYLFLGGDNSAELTGGPAGGATYALDANGRLTIHAAAGEQVVLSGLPASDPSVANALWNDGGIPVFSGSTAPGGGSGLYSAYLCYQDQKSVGTDGGTFTSGAWRKRDLNTEVADTGNHGTLASSQITLDAGTYVVRATAPGYACRRHQARLYDTTGSAVLALGTSAYADDGNGGLDSSGYVQNDSVVAGRFTLAVQSVLELQHRCDTTSTGSGFGTGATFGTEVFGRVELWKEA
jgi:hypothetical protein